MEIKMEIKLHLNEEELEALMNIIDWTQSDNEWRLEDLCDEDPFKHSLLAENHVCQLLTDAVGEAKAYEQEIDNALPDAVEAILLRDQYGQHHVWMPSSYAFDRAFDRLSADFDTTGYSSDDTTELIDLIKHPN